VETSDVTRQLTFPAKLALSVRQLDKVWVELNFRFTQHPDQLRGPIRLPPVSAGISSLR